ncbi:DUF3821 domain-containing protein [Methanoregula sp.]|uniref:DUF3821 domain-containing protein n=1 Tax=Methanoregula sp. TaxID=2052170 RepID=UPI002B764609|nr:DUF3821 domain-containing protein [Methanoregula sp.]HVP96714.1 DUF3821 domain-containing protein [Methanoregula sp.]
MLRSRIFPVFLLVGILCLVPVHASITKIAAGAPVFIGEQNVDISSGLNGHSVIAWWPPGADRSQAPNQTVTISGNSRAYYMDPAVFSGYTGTWYTHDVKPDIPAFVVYQPQINLSIWDTDTNTDVTGQSVPVSANITYRIDTNLYMALNYTYRPSYNPSDAFFTVTLTSPYGKNIPSILTGNVGDSATQVIPFDSNPVILSSPYIWQNGPAWDHAAKSTDGSNVYPPGTYTFVASQNLNGMSSSYDQIASLGTVTSGDRTITFVATALPTPTATVLPSLSAPTGTATAAVTTAAVPTTGQATPQPTSTAIPKKTTFAPLPDGIALLGLCLAGLAVALRRKY